MTTRNVFAVLLCAGASVLIVPSARGGEVSASGCGVSGSYIVRRGARSGRPVRAVVSYEAIFGRRLAADSLEECVQAAGDVLFSSYRPPMERGRAREITGATFSYADPGRSYGGSIRTIRTSPSGRRHCRVEIRSERDDRANAVAAWMANVAEALKALAPSEERRIAVKYLAGPPPLVRGSAVSVLRGPPRARD